MTRKPVIAAAAAAILLAGTAVAQQEQPCKERIVKLTSEAGEALGSPGHILAEAALRNLRKAAVRLDDQKLAEACFETVEAMEVALAAYRAAGPADGHPEGACAAT